MRLYDSIGPNPQVVRMVLAEKAIPYERQRVNLRDAENRRPPYLALNPTGTLPCLQLDDGTVLAEITAIAEYLDELHPEPPLLGTTPVERARTRMWTRRIDLNILEPMANGYRYGEGLDIFKDRIRCIPEASTGLKHIARHWLAWTDTQINNGPYVTGDRFTLADIMLFCFTNFGNKIGQPLDPAWTNLGRWFDRVAARPSTKA